MEFRWIALGAALAAGIHLSDYRMVFYALAQFAPGLGLGEFGASLLLIVSVASLWLAAWGHAWLQARDAARADDAASAAVRR